MARRLGGAAAILASGDEAAKAEVARKGRLTVVGRSTATTQLVKGVRSLGTRIFQPNELHELRVAEDSYQRGEVRTTVNEVLAVLQQGGIIPDAIHVAQRTDGTMWVVDGGQRYRAHYLAEKPIMAQLWAVDSEEQERQLF